jgi:hypothetical protein
VTWSQRRAAAERKKLENGPRLEPRRFNEGNFQRPFLIPSLLLEIFWAHFQG